MDHVPPKQFFPAEVRKSQSPNLWVVPTHKRCNEGYREDEEYFYHSLSLLVQNGNPNMGSVIYHDFSRRTQKPQTPAMLRALLKTASTVTPGGICLPPGIVRFGLDEYRVQRVAIKIAQGLFYLDQTRHLSRGSCKDIRLCEAESDVPKLYQLSWRGAGMKAVLPAVFSYRRCEFDNLHLFSMLFWEAFMFCAAFEHPPMASTPAALRRGGGESEIRPTPSAQPLPAIGRKLGNLGTVTYFHDGIRTPRPMLTPPKPPPTAPKSGN
jgi:hypothetical protein